MNQLVRATQENGSSSEMKVGVRTDIDALEAKCQLESNMLIIEPVKKSNAPLTIKPSNPLVKCTPTPTDEWGVLSKDTLTTPLNPSKKSK